MVYRQHSEVGEPVLFRNGQSIGGNNLFSAAVRQAPAALSENTPCVQAIITSPASAFLRILTAPAIVPPVSNHVVDEDAGAAFHITNDAVRNNLLATRGSVL